MSTLVCATAQCTTLSDGTNTTSSTNAIKGSAKAWVNFDGTTASPSTIRASYNVSSITKNGTGNYTVNFTTALADANYSISATPGSNGSNALGTATVNSTSIGANVAPSSSSFTFIVSNISSITYDSTYVNVSIFR